MKTLTLIILLLLASAAQSQTGWVRMPDGPWGTVDRIDFFDDTSGYVRSAGHVWVTLNGGLTWESDRTADRQVKQGCLNNPPTIQITETSVTNFYFRRDLLLFAGSSYEVDCDYNPPYSIGKVWVRTPTGPWNEIHVLPHRPVDQLLVFDKSVYVSSSGPRTDYDRDYFAMSGYLESRDAGKNWKVIAPISDSLFFGIKLAFESNTHGLAWVNTVTDHGPLATSNSQMLRTTDAGATWVRVTNPHSDYLQSDSLFYSEKGVYVFSSGEFQVSSSNGGQRWRADTLTHTGRDLTLREEFYSKVEGYQFVSAKNVTVIRFTSDSGGSWTEQLQITDSLIDLSAPSERVAYAVGPNGVWYKTTDGGGRFADVKQVDVPETKLRAWSSGDEIIIEGSDREEIRIFDLLGRLVRAGREERFGGMQPGVYVVVSECESMRVLVSP